MIKITVTGDTTEILKRLHRALFVYHPRIKAWDRIVSDDILNKILNSLRPMRSWSDHPTPIIVCELRRVQDGEVISNSMGVRLAPEGDRGTVDFLAEFIHNESCYPNKDLTVSPPSSDKKAWEGFY